MTDIEALWTAHKPDMIITSRYFDATWHGETVRQEWLARGANWRRAKREARKARDRRLREAKP